MLILKDEKYQSCCQVSDEEEGLEDKADEGDAA